MRLLCIHGDEGDAILHPEVSSYDHHAWVNPGFGIRVPEALAPTSVAAATRKYALDFCTVRRPAKPLKPRQGNINP